MLGLLEVGPGEVFWMIGVTRAVAQVKGGRLDVTANRFMILDFVELVTF